VGAALRLFGRELPRGLASPEGLLDTLRLSAAPRSPPRAATGEGAPLLFAAALYVAWVAYTTAGPDA
jgi:hypothetical protein